MKTLCTLVFAVILFVLVDASSFAQECGRVSYQRPVASSVARVPRAVVRVATAPVRFFVNRQPLRRLARKVFCR